MNRISSAPDDHFTASPDRHVIAAHQGTEGSRDPTICGGIVSPACVQSSVAVKSAKDDHFAAGPERRVEVSCQGRVGEVSSCPGIVSAWRNVFGNLWKSVRHIF